MRAAPRASLLVAFSLLTSAATAQAECAWVMWSYTFARSGFEAHDISLAYSTRQECEGALSETATVLKRNGYSDVKGGFPGSHEVVGQKGDLRWRYFCLPDTVDPRGPKAKARPE
jgi:hypothetical protein